jgi:hypothetical protein
MVSSARLRKSMESTLLACFTATAAPLVFVDLPFGDSCFLYGRLMMFHNSSGRVNHKEHRDVKTEIFLRSTGADGGGWTFRLGMALLPVMADLP